MTEENLFKQLQDNNIPFILIGGTALAAYGSSRKKVFGIEIKTASLEHLLIMKEKAVQGRENSEKKELDKIDITFIKNKLKKL